MMYRHAAGAFNGVHVNCLYQVLTVGPFIWLLFSHTREDVSRVISLKQKGFGQELWETSVLLREQCARETEREREKTRRTGPVQLTFF
jgi:hypothetical protein